MPFTLRSVCLTLVGASLAVLPIASSAVQGVAASRPAEPVKVAALSFLAGTWTGKEDGNLFEETWSAPAGNSLMGMYRMQNAAGETTLWEFMSITDSPEGPVLRIRHFDKAFEPWKSEAEGVPVLAVSALDASGVTFTNPSEKGGLAGIEYRSAEGGKLRVVVSFKDPKREALKFELARVPAK